jgi:hypothetical protein
MRQEGKTFGYIGSDDGGIRLASRSCQQRVVDELSS